MDRHSTPTRSDLECMLRDEKAEPKALPLSLLEDITNGFSEEREIGRGGFAVVYKGMLENGAAVAVKRISIPFMFEKEFHREVECLIKASHQNVIRFIGYCADSQGKAESYDGKFVMADVQQRLLCFEYLPHGTLDKYITDVSCGLDWRKRYRIINGICKGLHYLHENRILHLDLKPPNILLDHNMLPKIADFGLSRRFDEKQSRAITANMCGTFGYLAPEFVNGVITYRFDLYSLGVIIIEILTGKKGYHDVDDAQNAPSELHHDTSKAQRETSSENFLYSWSSNSFWDQRQPAQMSEVVLPSLAKINSILGDEDNMVIIANLSKKATSIKKLPRQVEEIGKQLSEMGIVVRQIGTIQLTDGIVKTWIGQVRKLAYRVEDVMDKCSYHVAELKGGFLKKFATKATHYVKVFTEIVDEVTEVNKEIKRVMQMKDQWLKPCEDSIPDFIKDEDLIGTEDNRILLTGWLYSEEPENTVITVSGMGGLGKSALASNVYECEKFKFPAHAWINVSQVYTVDALLRKFDTPKHHCQKALTQQMSMA
uniref:non-specific serine/threonine protein kinase n=1 Tax=Triticum urartu TaxID=4572 RepID=A0A8R7U3R0_TRIUA